MKVTKAPYLIQKQIRYHEKMEISNICRNNKFSMIIDKSTNISVSQALAVAVRYFDTQKCDVVDMLLDKVLGEKGTAEEQHQVVKDL